MKAIFRLSLWALFLSFSLSAACTVATVEGDKDNKGDQAKDNDKPTVKKEDLKEGKGAAAKVGDKVIVHYTGWFKNGKKFDSSLDSDSPFDFRIGSGEVIKGWDIGVEGMKVGGREKLIIPSELAYGKKGKGPIPPDTDLIFEIELLQIK